MPGARRWSAGSSPPIPATSTTSSRPDGCAGGDRLERRAAAVATTFGKGKLVLLGFRPQHRAQTPATFPFLFNALYWSVAK